MKKILSLALVAVMMLSFVTVSLLSASAEGATVDEPLLSGFSVDISVPDTYMAGEAIIVTVTVNNITAPNGLHEISFAVDYDYEKLEPVADFFGFVESLESYADWLEMSSVAAYEDGTYIECWAFSAGDEFGNNMTAATEDGQLVFNIPFIVASDATGDISISIEDTLTYGCYYTDPENFEYVEYVGTGSSAVIAEDENSVPTEPVAPVTDFDVEILAPETYVPGEAVEVTVTVNNITAETGLSGVTVPLYYDNSLLELANETDRYDFVLSFQGFENWMDYTTSEDLGDGVGAVYLSASAEATENFETITAGEGDSLTFVLNFLVSEDASGDIILDILAEEVLGVHVNVETLDILFYEGTGASVTISEGSPVTLGDINANGEIDSLDYILLKRAYFNTYALDENASKASDINGNGELDSLDYILLKRAYFGTYVIA